MEKSTLSKILDNIFLIFAVFIVAFLWVRYNEHNTLLILLYSSLITIVACTIFHLISKYKLKRKSITAKENKQINSLCDKLTFSTQPESIKIFEQALKQRNITYEKHKSFLFFDGNVIVPAFNKTKIDDNALLDIILSIKYKKLAVKMLCVCGNTFTDSAKKLANKFDEFDILIYDKRQTYLVFFKPVSFTINPVKKPKQKVSVKQKLKLLADVAFNKKRFKSYFLSALILFIASYFMRYNLYYLITSSVLVMFAFFSYFNKPFNKKETNLFGE